MALVLKHAVRSEIADVAALWADAFFADPFFRWIAPDDAQYKAFAPEWMTFIAEHCFERGHTFIDADRSIAIAWIPPDVAFVDADGIQIGRGIVAKHAGEQRADEVLGVIMTARGFIIEDPHWTLQYIGVAASAQGRGLGKIAAAPYLATADAEGLPTQLISTNGRNVAFYESLGFTVIGESPSPDGQATMRPMLRHPG